MYNQITTEKVNKFLEDVSKRNAQIDSKINKLDSEINSLNKEISKRQTDIVEYELNENIGDKNSSIKEISKYKVKLNDLIQEKAAYVSARKPGNSVLREKAEKINDAAEKEIDKIHELILKKRESISKLESKKNEIEKDITNEELELKNLEWNINNIEDFQIPKIAKYIDSQEAPETSHENRNIRPISGQVKFSTGDDSKPYVQQF